MSSRILIDVLEPISFSTHGRNGTESHIVLENICYRLRRTYNYILFKSTSQGLDRIAVLKDGNPQEILGPFF